MDTAELIRQETLRIEGHRSMYEYNLPTQCGEKLIVEIMRTEVDPTDKNCLPYLWKKKGWMDRVLPSYWSAQTYTYDSDGHCWGEQYNPLTKVKEWTEYDCRLQKDIVRKRRVINFDWKFEGTDENKLRILEEIERRAFGKAAVREIPKS